MIYAENLVSLSDLKEFFSGVLRSSKKRGTPIFGVLRGGGWDPFQDREKRLHRGGINVEGINDDGERAIAGSGRITVW